MKVLLLFIIQIFMRRKYVYDLLLDMYFRLASRWFILKVINFYVSNLLPTAYRFGVRSVCSVKFSNLMNHLLSLLTCKHHHNCCEWRRHRACTFSTLFLRSQFPPPWHANSAPSKRSAHLATWTRPPCKLGRNTRSHLFWMPLIVSWIFILWMNYCIRR